MKRMMIIGLSATLLLAACGTESGHTADAQTGAATMETGKESIKSQLMQFYLSVSKTINKEDGQLNAYEIAHEEGTLPSGDELDALEDSAIDSARKAQLALEKMEVPQALGEYSAEIGQALTLMAESYGLKMDELTQEEPDFEAAAQKFGEADMLLNQVLEANGLVASNMYNEVSK